MACAQADMGGFSAGLQGLAGLPLDPVADVASQSQRWEPPLFHSHSNTVLRISTTIPPRRGQVRGLPLFSQSRVVQYIIVSLVVTASCLHIFARSYTEHLLKRRGGI